jgi:orotate phosphoribosyltransferase
MTANRDFRTGYFDQALFDLPSLIEEIKPILADVDFDTIVGTGFSGGVVIPALALALGKDFVLIRKETDDSHHGAGRLLGRLGERWIFVDDFVSGGHTRRRVLEKVEQAAALQEVTTSYVGDFLYAHLQWGNRPDNPAWRPVARVSVWYED